MSIKYEDSRDMFFNLIRAEQWLWQYRFSGGAWPPLFADERNTWVDKAAEIGAGTIIYPFCVILGKTKIGERCIIYPGSVLINFTAGDDCHINLPAKKNSAIGDGCVIGEMAEMNRVLLGDIVKFLHHGYMGDAIIGDESNIGAGAITGNYDGVKKNKTVLGKETFVGINVNMVAPNEFPEGTLIAAGSTIESNLNERRKAGGGEEIPPFHMLICRAKEVFVKARKKFKKE